VRRVLTITLLLAAVSANASSVDAVRRNYLDFYSAAGADRSSPRMQAALGGLEDAARSYAAPGFLLANGSWSDIDYSDVPDGGWSPWAHSQRLWTMAKAYRTPGQRLYNDPQLRASIESALSFVPRYYGVTTYPGGNWWFWSLGVPLDLGPTLVLMRGDVSQKVYDDCVTTLAFHIGSSPTARALVDPVPVGENLVWSSFTHLALALARDDASMLAAVRDAMASAAMPTSGDGIQPDSSFHQHGAQLYTGGYGAAFANDMARYALITRSSEFALPPSAMNGFADYLAGGVAWSLYGNYFDVSTVGREVARPSTTGYHGVAALVQGALADLPRGAEIRTAAAKMLQSWQWTLPTELAGLATIAERGNGAWPSGHQHYYLSDYTIHRRPGWFASVKMFSSRTKSGEKTNDENILGSRESDGRFYLVLNGNEYFERDVWPSLDWSRLPGITVEQKTGAANDVYGYGTRAFVGGASDGINGVSAMDFAPVGSQLTAKKSWFFFDDSIVFLTNSISLPVANPVETIIQQWPLADPNAPLLRGTNWLWSENVGYYIYPQTATLRVTRDNRIGSWASLGASDDTTPKSATFLTIVLDHGIAPAGAIAAYAIVPNISSTSMASWSAPQIVANDARASAVRSGEKLGIVFWAAGASVSGYTSSIPAVVYINGNLLTASDPTNGNGYYSITIPGGRTLTLARNGGKSVTVSLEPPKRRSARH
jgi:chondroitin AC lyase